MLGNLYQIKHWVVTYSGRSGDRYTGLGAQTLPPQNTFQVFFFQLYFNKKYVEVATNDFTMHLIISRWLRIKKALRQKGQSERRNCQQNCFNYVTDHASIRFFFYVNSLHCFVRFLLYYLLHLLSSDRFVVLTSLYPYKFFIRIYEFFKNHPRKSFS